MKTAAGAQIRNLRPIGYVKITDVERSEDHAVRFSEFIDSGDQTFGEEQASVAAMADTVRAVGQLQGILVVRGKTKPWRLIAGDRRLRALELAKQEEVFATEWIGGDLAGVPEIENLARKKMSAAEITSAVRRLVATPRASDGRRMSADDVALRLGLSVDAARAYLAIARGAHPLILAAWRKSPGAFRTEDLARVATMSPELQIEWLRGRAVTKAAPVVKNKAPKRVRARHLITKRRDDVRKKKECELRSADYREGYADALSFVLGERS